MRPFLETAYGNPSSPHWAGRPAKEAIEAGRGKVAGLLGCHADEIVFTGGGSEANNHALKGVAHALRTKGDHIVTSAVEHPAIIEPCRFLRSLGFRISYLPVDGAGRIDPDDLRRAITPKTILVSIMHANNEVGTVQPIEEVSRITRPARRPAAHRRRAIHRQDRDGRGRARRRSSDGRRPQALRAKGRGCALCQARHAVGAADPRRWP